MQSDLSDGIDALPGEGTVDPKRVCIVGASYGGYAALAGVTLQKGVYPCAVSVAGPADFPKFFGCQTERHGYKSDAPRYGRADLGPEQGDDAIMAHLRPGPAARQQNDLSGSCSW